MAAAAADCGPPAAPPGRRRSEGPSYGSSWSADLQAYEHTKRRSVDPGLLVGSSVSKTKGDIAQAERQYDTLLQRYRDEDRERSVVSREKEERVKRLNRAFDVQLKREQHHNIINNEGRLDPIHVSDEFKVPEITDYNTAQVPIPASATEYNIISNLPMGTHHWAHPDLRPKMTERYPQQRQVPAVCIKDFNILTNRYLSAHEDKQKRDEALNLLEATEKFRKRNRFDPLLQKMTDNRAEERLVAVEDTNTVAVRMVGVRQEPLSYRGRVCASFDMVGHRVLDPDMLSALDKAQDARTKRYAVRHEKEAEHKARDIFFQDMDALQKHEQIAPERFEETTARGYDLLTNQEYRPPGVKVGNKFKTLFPSATKQKPTMWEKAHLDHEEEEMLEPPIPKPTGATLGCIGAIRPPERSATPHRSGSKSARSSQSMPHSARLPLDRTQLPPQLSNSGAMPMSARGSSKISAPPPPAVPGSSGGSVYSRPSRREG